MIALPAGSTVAIDADALIYSVETIDPYWPLLRPLWDASRAGQVTVIGTELLVVAALTGPLKTGDKLLVQAYERALAAEIRLLPISRSVLRTAAELRAAHALKTPDAIHAATAIAGGCSMFVTNDPAFTRVPNLPVQILDRALSP